MNITHKLEKFAITIKNSKNRILAFFFLLTSLGIFLPSSPGMPSANLDPSWVFGLNQAVSDGLIFGKDIIFTFGPLASLYTKSFHPGTDTLMLFGCIYLALCFTLAIYYNFRNSSAIIIFSIGVFLVERIYTTDSLLFFYTLLAGFYICKTYLHENINYDKNKLKIAILAIIISPLGILPIIKGSNIFSCCSVLIVTSFALLLNKNWKPFIIILTSPIVTMLFFWYISGQPISAIPQFFISIAPIISGYTEAMATNHGNFYQVIFYLLGISIFVFSIYRTNNCIKKRIIMILLLVLVSFLAYKGAFVRHDGHALIAGTFIILTSALVSTVIERKYIIPCLVISIITWSIIDAQFIKTNTEKIYQNIITSYIQLEKFPYFRIANPDALTYKFNKRVCSIQNENKFPKLQGTTDIYSYNQGYLIASGNKWNPRPIFQSYCVFTPKLFEINKNHLLNNPPDNIIFKVQTIDGRFQNIEDGASWPVLLTNYDFNKKLNNDFILLTKKGKSLYSDNILNKIGEHYISFDEIIKVPSNDRIIFAKLSIEKSLLGYILNLIYKTSQLHIKINLEDGQKLSFRTPSGMIQTPFLISHNIDTSNKFILLHSENLSELNGSKISSISFNAKASNILWKNKIKIEFFALDKLLGDVHR